MWLSKYFCRQIHPPGKQSLDAIKIRKSNNNKKVSDQEVIDFGL